MIRTNTFCNKLAGPIKLFLVLGMAISLTGSNLSAFAQSTFATVQGTVLDASGAIVPEATVTITDENTGTVETLHTNGNGEYRALDLNAGTYTLVIAHAGFGDQTIAHQTVLARQVLRIDGKLTAGGISQSVEVTAQSSLSDTSTVSASLSSADIDTLALNFRATDNTSPLYVATLTPGVQTDPSGNISVAGGFSYTTSYSIDGISTVNVRRNGPSANLFPSVEAISEFKVNSANDDAEFGQPSDITVTTKGGTEKFHGGAYEFLQNSYFNASNPLTRSTPTVKANDFGGYLGGPLFVPGMHTKGKTFFFGDYEGTRRPEAGSISIATPTPAFRTGDLSAICTVGFTAAGICTNLAEQLHHPFSATPFLNNQVPVNASSLSLINALYPAQNTPGAAANYVANFPGKYTLNNGDVRIDENITDKHHVWVRFGAKNVTQTGTDGSTSYDPINGIYSNTNRLRNLVASYSWTITPTIINEVRGGESISDLRSGYPFAAQGAAVYAAAGITGLPTPPPSGGVPALDFGDTFGTNNQDGRPEVTKNLTYNISDLATVVRGRHAIKFGVDYEHFHFRDILDFTAGDQYGDYSFSGAITGEAYSDFIQGYPTYTDYSVDGPDVLPYSHSWGFYAQDSWKPLPNLTVDYGLRYELHPPFDDATHQLANFDPNYPGGRVVVQGQTGLNLVLPVFAQSIGSTPIVTNQQAGLPTTLRKTYYGDIDPRFGFTWQPYQGGGTVVHAGVGAYTVPVLGSVLYSLAGVATSNYLLFPTSAAAPIVLPDAFPTGAAAPPSRPDFRRANQINLKDPRQVQWNGSIEQKIGFSSVFRLGYTGSHTTQLIQSPDLNQVEPNTASYTSIDPTTGLPVTVTGYAALTATPALREANLKYPNFNAVLTRSNGPSAKYDALTAEVERRYVKGLTLDVNYTWAKDTSNALGAVPSTLTAENGATILNAYNLHADYGPVIYVARNRFVGTFQYELPYGRGQHFGSNINRATNLALGGWSVAGIFLDHSGHFLTPSFSGFDPSGTGVLSRGVTSAQRPDCTGVSPNLAGHNRNGYFNPAAFSTAAFVNGPIGRFGNCPVGILTGPGTVTFAGTGGKNFALTERFNLRYEAQVANLFNHTNLGDPATNISSSTFGQITNVQDANTSYGPSAGPRNIQMSLRLTF